MKKKNRVASKEQVASESVKKSTLTSQTSLDLKKLTFPLPVFAALTFQHTPEVVRFTYDLTGLKPVSELKKEEMDSQYQFLINFEKLFDTWKSFNIPMTPNNIFYDENFLPYVKFRDLNTQAEAKNPQEFISDYKTFIGGILGKKYTIDQIQTSGLEVLKKKSYFADYYKATSIEALVAILRQRKKEDEINQKNTTQLVSKGSYRFRSRLAFIAPMLLLVAVIAFTYSNARIIPFQEQIITAHDAYIWKDFDDVIYSLLEIEVGEMNLEMLKTPDAANIVEPGRSYLQVGNNEIYELFQSAWSGAIYDGDQTEEEKEDDRVYLVNELGQGELLNKDLSKPVESNQIKATQLDVVVDHLAEVYKAEQHIPVKKPWLPSLTSPMASPHTKQVFDSATFEKGNYQLGIGMIDIPEEQPQEEYVLDLVKNGHLLYMASSGYGKSVLLSNIIIGLAMKNAVKNLHMYIIDLGNNALIPLRGLPHVADYMGLDDKEKIKKFQKLIIEEIASRKRLLAQAMAQNFNVYNESQPTPLKAIVIAVDNYDVVNELDESVTKFLQKASRDGASLGIYLIMTMSRDNVMRSATKGNFKERIAGYNFVSGDNQGFIGRSNIELSEDKHGQALIKRDQVNMMQLYTPVAFENEISYNANLQALAKQIQDASSEEKAKGIPTLPDDLYYDMLPEYPAYEHSLTMLPVGLDVVDLEVKYLDVKKEPALIIGNSGMGRTNMVRNILRHLAGQQICLFDNNSGDLMAYANQEKLYYAGSDDAMKLLEMLKAVIKNRTEIYEATPNQTLTLKAFGQSLEQPVFVIIDGIQELNETLGDEGIDVFAEAVQCGVYVIVTADLKFKVKKGKFTGMLTESKHGLIVGNLKAQGVFSSGGLREENRQVDLGYYHVRGENQKVKLIEHMDQEMRQVETKNGETAGV